MKRVLVSGSHGLIGSALCRHLARKGTEVVVLVREGAGGARSEPTSDAVPGAAGPGPNDGARSTVRWDPGSGRLDPRDLERHGPYDAVVHLAGAGIGDRRWTARRKQLILHSRVGATNTLVEAVSHLDPIPAVLVSASAVGYYGDRGREVLTEASPPGRGFLSEVCQAWEAAARRAASAGTRVVSLRTGLVLSRGGGALGRQLPLFRLGLGGRLGAGDQYLSWITLEDEVRVIHRALTDPALEGPVNATAPRAVTNAEFTRALGEALGRPTVLGVPSPALSLALGHEMAHELLLVSQRVTPAKLLSSSFEFTANTLDEGLGSVLG